MSGATVVRGDPGIGKSTLLDEAIADAVGIRLLRVDGYEAESALAYGALHRLWRPLEAYLDELPAPQRAALLTAVGLAEARPPEPALVGLALLSLLARAGDDAPVVCVVDDAHQLDTETLEVLGLLARRLSAESVVLLFAARESDAVTRHLAGVPEVVLTGLDRDTAIELLARNVSGVLDPTIAAQIVADTQGNPLALSELGAEWDARRLTASALAHTPAPLGSRLERHYLARVDSLPADARRWALIAAAESAGDASVIHATAAALGLDPAASAPLEQARLLVVRDTVRFRHPLVRSAIYSGATDADRRAVHAALRTETAARGLRELTAWHAAAASAAPDAAVAAELVAVADTAGSRGGLATRARLLARAAELSPEPAARNGALLLAAESAIGAGAGHLARQLLAQLDPDIIDPISQARAVLVSSVCAMFLSDPVELALSPQRLLDAADQLEGVAPQLLRRALLDAIVTMQTSETDAEIIVPELGTRMRRAAAHDEGVSAIVLEALASFILDPYPVAAPRLRAAIDALETLPDEQLLEYTFIVVIPATALWDADAADRLLRRSMEYARGAGSLRELDAQLWVLSAVELSRSNPLLAGRYMEQVTELRRGLGYGAELVVNAAHLAWTGAPRELVSQISDTLRGTGFAGVSRMARAATAIHDIASGDYAPAYRELRELLARPFLQASFHQVPEFAEAAARTGHLDEARAATARMHEYATESGSPWAGGLWQRCEALLCEGPDAERRFVESIALLSSDSYRAERARSRLLYGEWLRRERRRRDAGEQLRAAWEVFDKVGSRAFAERALRELRALGEHVEADTPTAPAHDALTPQEAEVARRAARGATNAEIAAAMFISPNTVDYHLRKVFRKLGVTSRRQLAERFPAR